MVENFNYKRLMYSSAVINLSINLQNCRLQKKYIGRFVQTINHLIEFDQFPEFFNCYQPRKKKPN